MKLLLTGHGRMGRLIEQTALAAGDEIAGVFDEENIGALAAAGRKADVVMDFSSPAALPQVADYVRRTGTALLSGTTGFSAGDLDTIRRLGQYAPVLYSANYSIGVAVFRQILEEISDTLKPDFDIEIVETHHNQKADAPSGTARLLLDAIDPRHQMKPVYGRQGICGKREKNEIGIHALRGGTVAGEHTVRFFGVDEELEITHRAGSRQIFVNGALQVARRLIRMPKGSYQLRDILFGGR